jgi:uncharacterized protein YggE
MEIDKVKNYFWIVFTLLLAGLLLNLVFFVMPMLQKLGDSFMPVRTITVSAEGKTTVAPDLAQFSFSVVTQGKDPSQIVDENNKKVSAAINFVKSQGVDAKDIKTSGYNLSPDYRYDENIRRSFIVGYTITQSVNVKVRDFDKLPKVLSGLTPVGVNQISGISFSVEDPERFMKEARKIAFERARAKAESMASQNGVGLGKVVNINEFGGPTPIPYFRGAALEAKGGDSITPPTIEPGTQEVTIQVSVTYALR